MACARRAAGRFPGGNCDINLNKIGMNNKMISCGRSTIGSRDAAVPGGEPG